MAAPIRSRQVRGDGLVGTLCAPVGSGPAPGVLLLGGSEGGAHERDARLLAAEGFTVLALAYFGGPGLPDGLVDIPVEYFSRGLDLLAAQPDTEGRLGVVGGSRGGEAALLVAAHDPRVGAVVSVVGSGVLTQGIDFRLGSLLDILATPTTSWTLGGRALPYLPYTVDDELRRLVLHGAPVPLALAFPPPPTDPAELDRVSIPVERIAGPVLLLSAQDDRNWPSAAYSQVAADRLAGHPHRVEHRILPGAGHGIAGPPGAPFTTTLAPGPAVTFETGGTPEINTRARADCWSATTDFLTDTLTA
jgi:dienelactone hydrolase